MRFAQHKLTNICTSVHNHRSCTQVISRSSTHVAQHALPHETFDYTAHESSASVFQSAMVCAGVDLYTPMVKTISPTKLPPTSCSVHSLHVRMSSLWPIVSSSVRYWRERERERDACVIGRARVRTAEIDIAFGVCTRRKAAA
jgi:hypothetical protein